MKNRYYLKFLFLRAYSLTNNKRNRKKNRLLKKYNNKLLRSKFKNAKYYDDL